MKEEDPIEEVRRIREALAEECGFDVDKIFEKIKEGQKGVKTVTRKPRRPAGWVEGTLPEDDGSADAA